MSTYESDIEEGPNPVDVHVGHRIRLRRKMLGFSQEKLGESVGLSFQQVQKYEKGTNRVGAGKLWRFAATLGVPVGFFFEGASDSEFGGARVAEPRVTDVYDPHIDAETLDLVEAYYSINDERVRTRFVSLLRSVAESADEI
ncbi:MAG: helix-turn-helix transcriptional regulator [Azospirillaceae bacterium]